jgi:hypothetical protein
MKRYYIDIEAQKNGDHVLHNEFCLYMPIIIRSKYIGEFSNSKAALKEAEKEYNTANGCNNCSPESYTDYEKE